MRRPRSDGDRRPPCHDAPRATDPFDGGNSWLRHSAFRPGAVARPITQILRFVTNVLVKAAQKKRGTNRPLFWEARARSSCLLAQSADPLSHGSDRGSDGPFPTTTTRDESPIVVTRGQASPFGPPPIPSALANRDGQLRFPGQSSANPFNHDDIASLPRSQAPLAQES